MILQTLYFYSSSPSFHFFLAIPSYYFLYLYVKSQSLIYLWLRTNLLVNSDIVDSCFVYAIMLMYCSALPGFLLKILPLLTLPLKSISMSHLACKLNVGCFGSLVFLFLCVSSPVLVSFPSFLGACCNYMSLEPFVLSCRRLRSFQMPPYLNIRCL